MSYVKGIVAPRRYILAASKKVDEYFNWIQNNEGKTVIATCDVLRLALSYSLEREASMRVFLRDPTLQLDTNHLEREIRPIAIGRKNWLFCWTEVGAKSLCVYQSLIRTESSQKFVFHTRTRSNVSAQSFVFL